MAIMKILNCDYIKSAPALKDCPDFGTMPEFALVGRSNVGKSSFINCMVGRKNIARTSNTPGKTRYINFYQLSYRHRQEAESKPSELLFVDLPGYGYAKVSHTEQAKWREQLENYLQKRQSLKAVVQLIDARHGALENDIAMFEWLQFHGLRTFVVLTKCDKVKQRDLAKTTKASAQAFDLLSESFLHFSAETQLGRSAMWSSIQSLLDK